MKGLMLIGVLLGLVSWAHANSILVIDDGLGNSVTFTSGGVLTHTGSVGGISANNSVAGLLVLQATIGNWVVNVGTGTGSPIQPIATLDLGSVNINPGTGPGTGSLRIRFSQDGNTGGNGQWALSFGGVLANGQGATVGYKAFMDTANTLLAETTAIGTLGLFGPGAFSGSGYGPTVTLLTPSPYSLTQEVDISGVGFISYSGDANLTPVPEPASLLLMGSGLLGLASIGRKKFLKN